MFVGEVEDTSRFLSISSSTDTVRVSGNAQNIYINSAENIALVQDASLAGGSITATSQTTVGNAILYDGIVRAHLSSGSRLYNQVASSVYPISSGNVIITGSGEIGSAASPVGLRLPASATTAIQLSATGSLVAFRSFVPVILLPFRLLQTNQALSDANFALAIAPNSLGNRDGSIVLETRGIQSGVTGVGDIIAGQFSSASTTNAGSIVISSEGALAFTGDLFANSVELVGLAIANRSIANAESLTVAWASNTTGRAVGSSATPIQLHAPLNGVNAITLRAGGSSIYLNTTASLILPANRASELATVRIFPQYYQFGNLSLHDAYVHGTIDIRSSATAASNLFFWRTWLNTGRAYPLTNHR